MAKSKSEKTILSYNYGAVMNPMLAQGQHFDRPIGELLRKTAIWRYTTLFLLALGLFLTVILMLAASNSAQTVYFAGVSKYDGKLLVAGKLTKTVSFADAVKRQQLEASLLKRLKVSKVQWR